MSAEGPPHWLRTLGSLPDAALERAMKSLPPDVVLGLDEEWALWAHGGQREPAACDSGEDWRTWVMMAGRGFGKTRAGAEWVSARAREMPGAKIALVGANIDDVVKVMVKGTSGLIAVARADEAPRWVASRAMLAFPSGAEAFAYSGERPDSLRGPEHHFAWCDELSKWAHPQATWDMLMLGLRLGERPRAVVTTTPKPGAALKRIMALERCAKTYGRTPENVHLPAEFLDAVTAMYAGTRLGRQELDGELIEDVEGALWTRALIEKSVVGMGTVTFAHGGDNSGRDHRKSDCPLRRVVIGVDPPAGVGGDACGIVAAGLGEDGIAYVLGDASVAGLSPEGWARTVAGAAQAWAADRVIAEANNGGKMVETVLRGAAVSLPVKLVHASHGKAARAEPVAALFESGRAKLAGRFPDLEDELCGLTIAGGYEGPGRSPDRADAMVWALTELMLGPQQPAPRVRGLG